jgi:hypothetical protein
VASNNPLAPLGLGAAQAALGQLQQTQVPQYYISNAYYPGMVTAANTATNVVYYSYGLINTVTGNTDFQYYQAAEEQLVAQREIQRREFEAEQVTQAQAARTAAELLLAFLDSEQRGTWEANQFFIVEGSNGNRYKLSLNRQPARLGDDDGADITYCIHTYGVPREDELLGFKLLLEANEDLFLSTANATRVRMPPLARQAIAAD